MLITSSKDDKDTHCIKRNRIKRFIIPVVLLFTASFLIIFFTLQPKKLSNKSIVFNPATGSYPQTTLISLSSYKKSDIYYSLDGSKPTTSSFLYDKPIKIGKSTVIRAQAYKNNEILGKEVSNTYIINDSFSLPIVSIITDPVNLWDEKIGIYIVGPDPLHPNYEEKGKEWERPGVMQLISETGELMYESEINMRIHGAMSKKNDQKSLRLYPMHNGEESQFNYQFFPNIDRTKFSSLILRNSGNDWFNTLMRDALIHKLASEVDIETQAYRPFIVFINGEYWGIQNLREHYSRNYLAEEYLDKASNFVILGTTNNYLKEGMPYIEDGAKGDDTDYARLWKQAKKFRSRERIINEDEYFGLKNQIDIDNLFNYSIVQMYFANHDWPFTNIEFYRYKTEIYKPTAPYPKDGLWRWLLYDTDAGFALFNGNYQERTVDPPASRDMTEKFGKPTFIFEPLVHYPETQYQFLNKYADLLNSTFLTEHVIDQINEYAVVIDPEMERHINKWKDSVDFLGGAYIQDKEEWLSNVQFLRDFAKDRPDYAYQNLVDYFKLDGLYKLNIKNDNNDQGYIKVNSLVIKDQSWSGYYFHYLPLPVEAQANKGYKFDRWEIEGLDDEIDLMDDEIIIQPDKNVVVKAIFRESNILNF